MELKLNLYFYFLSRLAVFSPPPLSGTQSAVIAKRIKVLTYPAQTDYLAPFFCKELPLNMGNSYLFFPNRGLLILCKLSTDNKRKLVFKINAFHIYSEEYIFFNFFLSL